MVNSVYGKTMENLRNRIKVRLVTEEKDVLKYTNKPTTFLIKSLVKNMLQFMKLNQL